jgi:hypothetical protein
LFVVANRGVPSHHLIEVVRLSTVVYPAMVGILPMSSPDARAVLLS